MNAYTCQHCGSGHPPAEWMYHKPTCPHGRIDPARLDLIPAWKLEEELLRRAMPRVLTELVKSDGACALEHAAMLSDCLVLLRKLQLLTRYVRSNTTVLNVKSALLCELDRIMSERGFAPPETDHAD